MDTEKKLMKTNGKAITERELRAALDTVAMDDHCSGWRSMSELTDAMADAEPNRFMCRRKVDYWLTHHNQGDRFFESRFIDGEWCYRSHKFNLCRDRFMQTIQEYRQKVLRYPEKQTSLKASLALQLRAALQPSVSARQQFKAVHA